MPLYAKVDVSFPDDPRTVEAGDLAELVYYRCLLRGRENLTDGIIDRRVLTRWLAGIRGKPETHMAQLVAVGYLEEHPDGWRIPLSAWKKWNPLKADVEEKRAEDAERKRKRRAPESGERPRGHDTDSDGTTTGVRAREKQQPEPEPKSEPAATVSERDIEDETVRRVNARRRRGEDIGQGLIKLIRQDVVAELEAGKALRCGQCDGSHMSGTGMVHELSCPSLDVFDVREKESA